VLPTGEQIAIAHGDQRAVICEVGATLRTYVRGGVPVIEGFAAEDLPDGARGQIMFPWPNRLSEEPWEFSGRRAYPAIDDPGTGTAIHGNVRWRPFRVEQVNQNRALLSLTVLPTPDYPFAAALNVAYHLGSQGLTVTTHVTNLDEVPIPVGVGFHPYLAVTSDTVEGTELEVPARAYVATDSRLLPTGAILPVNGNERDFTESKSVSGHELNVTYTELVRDDSGWATVRVRDARGGLVELQMDRTWPYVQLYTGDELARGRRRTSIAVEPMTCPPEGLRSGKDLIVLEPGQLWAGSWRLRRLSTGDEDSLSSVS
jgi:aldose 1-epimerase